MNKAADRIDEFLASEQPKIGQGKTKKEIKSNITDNESAKMTTSKGTIQGYNGVATVDSKHQIIVDAQAFGHGQEHHTLEPVVTTVKERFKRLGIKNNIFTQKGTKLAADTGFSNEQNNEFLYKNGINAFIPDRAFAAAIASLMRKSRSTANANKMGSQNSLLATLLRMTSRLINAGLPVPARLGKN